MMRLRRRVNAQWPFAHVLIAGKRGRDASAWDRPQTPSPLKRTERPRAEHRLPLRLYAMVNNDAFLREWVANNTIRSINRLVRNATVGFYGALNQSNRFWYWVAVKEFGPQRVGRWDSRINYKRGIYGI